MMQKTMLVVLVCLSMLVGLAGCGGGGGGNGNGGVIEGGYTLPGIPVRISLNSNGEVNVGLSGSYATPLGTFDVGYGGSVYSLRQQHSGRLLVVRVDGKATVYQMEEGKELHVEFDDNNRLYRRVALNHEDDGDIVLELESVQKQGQASAGGNNAAPAQPVKVTPEPAKITSCPGAPPQRIKNGGRAHVCTASDTVKLRERPGKQYNVLKYLSTGDDLAVVGGPKCADDWSWWKVRTDAGLLGWIAEGGDAVDRYFICPG